MDILSPATIRTHEGSLSRNQAIDLAGELLVEAGAVSADYVTSMHEREGSVSTYMGNFLAIPHGTDSGKTFIQHSALSVIRTSEDVDWGGKPVRFIIGIAGIGDEHLGLLSNIAIIFSDGAAVERLLEAPDAAALFNELAGVNS